MRRKKRKYSMLLLLLVLGVTVGYAFLSTTLNINGTTKIKDAKWDVYWDNPVVTTGSVTTTVPTIDSIKTTATFDITLNNPKDFYEFTIDAVNAGTIDAMIKVNGVNNKVYSDSARTQETTLPTAISYTVTYADGGTIADKHLLAKKSGNTPTRETYKVRVEYRDDISAQDLEEITEETTYYMSFNVEYVQAENAIEAHPSAISYINRQVEGQITPGDIIGIGKTEDFYVLSSDSNKTVLLAKYNLLVGISYYDRETYEEIPITTSTPGYGLQSIDAVGGYNSFPGVAIVSFSDTNYWSEGTVLKSPYNENDTIYYDSDSYQFKYRNNDTIAYPSVYDENSNLYQYISGENGYINRLKELGAPPTITGRILTVGEALMYKDIEDNGVSIIYDQHQNYWVDYPCMGSCAYGIPYDTDEGFVDQSCASTGHFGVRPVIEIPTSVLK